MWLTFGLSVGIVSAVKHRSIFDRTAIVLSLVAISAPAYWLGLVVLYLFAPDFGVFDVGFLGGQGSYVPFSDDPVKWFQSLVLPWCVIATAFAAGYARLLRRSPARRRDPDGVGVQHPRHRPARLRRDHARRPSDHPGTVLFGAFVIIVMNLIVDVMYAFLDPRVRY